MNIVLKRKVSYKLFDFIDEEVKIYFCTRNVYEKYIKNKLNEIKWLKDKKEQNLIFEN
jgi:hypothetical protein